jgi:hypothetical protein
MERKRPRRIDDGWILEATPGRQTTSTGVADPDITRQADQTISTIFTMQADSLRFRARIVTDQADDVHQVMYMKEWQLQTQQRAESSVVVLLTELADNGFAWRDVARLMSVSVPAIQKWRKGGPTTPENRQRLARLLAACDLIIRHRDTADIGQWFEMPLVQAVPVTPIDLWSAGEYNLVFEYALQHHDPEVLLDRFQPDWRERYNSDYETFLSGDGQLSIRLRDR